MPLPPPSVRAAVMEEVISDHRKGRRHDQEGISGIHFNANKAIINAHTVASYNAVNSFNNATITIHQNLPAELPLKNKIIGWLRFNSFTYQQTHDEEYSRRSPGTGKEFFSSKEYNAWIEEFKAECRNLACIGDPGVGKTCTASAVVEDIAKRFPSKENLVVYAYFKHSTQLSQRIPIVFANLLSQVVEAQSEPSEDIVGLYEYYLQGTGSGTVPRLDRTTSILQREFSKYGRVYIVIDALDEFSLNNDSYAAELVEKLQLLGTKLLITSRHTINFAAGTFSVLKVYASDEDIRIFIQERLPDRLRKHISTLPELQDVIIKKITSKCTGMFIVARLLLESLATILTIREIREMLEKLPEGLDGTYRSTMDRIDSQSPSLTKLAKQVLSWVRFSKRRLKVAELRNALAIRRSMEMISKEDFVLEDDILLSCAGLVVFVKEYDLQEADDRLVQFVHLSTQEFFERTSQEYLPNAQIFLTESCLRYLTLSASSLSEEVCQRYSRYFFENAELERHLARFPLTDYAATHWGSHAFDINEEFDLQLVTNLYGYPTSPYLAKTLCHNLEPIPEMPPQHYQILHAARFGLTSLWKTHQHQEAGYANSFLELCADPKIQDSYDRCALHLSALGGHHEIVHSLVKIVKDVNIRDAPNRTPLSYAAENGHLEIVEVLLEANADSNISDVDDWTPLSYAALRGHSNIALMLLEKGALVCLPDETDRAPLLCAAQAGHLVIATMLLNRAADANVLGVRQRTALSFAAEEGHVEIVKALLGNGGDPAIPDIDNTTPLAYAAKEGRTHVVELLLKEGVSPDIADSEGRTPLSHAAEGNHPEVLALLLNSSVKPNMQCNRGRTPLLYAASEGCTEVVRMLLEKGADPNIGDEESASPLFRASGRGHEAIVGMLVESGADVNRCTDRGRAPLYGAINRGHTEIVNILLSHGANPTKADELVMRSPLSVAAGRSRFEIAKMLLQKLDVVGGWSCEENLTTSGILASTLLTHNRNTVPVIQVDGGKQDGGTHTPQPSSLPDKPQKPIRRFATIDTPDVTGRAPISYAIHPIRVRPSLELISTILALGVDVDREDINHETPLSLARKSENPEIESLVRYYAILSLSSWSPAENRDYMLMPRHLLTVWSILRSY